MRIRCFVLVLLLGAGWPAAAAAAPSLPVADPTHCTTTVRFVVCPAGDVPFEVVVLDQYWMPMAGSGVWIDFSRCAGLRLCPDCCAGAVVDPAARTIRATTDASGRARFWPAMGGVCNGSTVSVSVAAMPGDTRPTVFLKVSAVSSSDQDGDLDVDADDVGIVTAALYTINWGADFNGDGEVSPADLAWLTNGHVGHACAGVVPARASTWGALKLHYR